MRATSFAAVITLAIASGACATPPTTEINDAKTAVDNAVAANANEYAPQSLTAALNARSKLDAELKVQDGHLPMMRSYDEALKLAQVVRAAGKTAEEDAKKGEQLARAEASTFVVDARAAIRDAESQVDRAPKKRKAAPAELDAMSSGLAAAESAVDEAETALANQRFGDAKAKAETAKQAAEGVVASVQHAREVRPTAATRRR